MAKDLTVMLENRPGTLADALEATGRAGVNVEGACGFPSEGRGVFHILVEDPATARQALEAAGLEVRDERDVLVLQVQNRPGEGGEIFRRLADAGINANLIYTATNNRLVIGVDEIEKARGVV